MTVNEADGAAALVACLTRCGWIPVGACTTAKSKHSGQIARAFRSNQGRQVRSDLYTLTNKNGLVAKITNYGAIVTELHVPDKNGDAWPTSCSVSRPSTATSEAIPTSARSSGASPTASAMPSSRWRARRTRWRRTTSPTTCTAAGEGGTRWSGTRSRWTPPKVRRSS